MPENGHGLSPRENIILTGLVGDFLSKFHIILEDHYYYTKYDLYYNRFNDFNELKDYILLKYYMSNSQPKECLELLKVTKLDLSFDDNWPIWWACSYGHAEMARFLLKDKRVDPSVDDNECLKFAYRYGHREIIDMLLKDERVRSMGLK